MSRCFNGLRETATGDGGRERTSGTFQPSRWSDRPTSTRETSTGSLATRMSNTPLDSVSALSTAVTAQMSRTEDGVDRRLGKTKDFLN